LTGQKAGIVLLIVSVIGIILYGMVSAGTNVWAMEIVDIQYRADYFSRRELLDKFLTCISVFALGFILDFFHKGFPGFLIIYVLSFSYALIQFFQLCGITDVEYELSKEKTAFIDLIRIPFRNKEYRNLTVYISIFFFFAWLCYSFRNIYMIKYLNISYVAYSLLYSFRMIVQGVASPFWGKLGQKKGWYIVFVWCLVYFSLEYISWALVTHVSLWMLVVSHAFSGIANSGLVLSTLNLRFDKMPKIQKSVYEGFYNLLLGIGCILGPFVGNLLRVNLPVISGNLFPNSQIQLVFLISFIVNNLLIFYLIINKSKFTKSSLSI
jgi:Na+/melibiose symporter-like transporter